MRKYQPWIRVQRGASRALGAIMLGKVQIHARERPADLTCHASHEMLSRESWSPVLVPLPRMY